MKLLRTICVLGLALCLATSVYAGTQSVKISGDLAMRSFIRGNYDLDGNTVESVGDVRTGNQSNWASYFMSTAEVQIDADLTDNVSAVLRLYNQRDWNLSTKNIQAATSLANLGRNGYTENTGEFDIGLDLAYVELKEFLYSPLTLKIGRQDIWIGRGFIVGANLRDSEASITADEYSAMTSFDAIRATLDYDPWTIDVLASKIWENDDQSADDVDLYGLNVGYLFDVYNAEGEAYWFNKDDDSIESWNIKSGNNVHTLGVRGSADPIENWTVAAETAAQWGTFTGSRHQLEKRKRAAWALDIDAECRHFKEQHAWKPVFGAEYIFYSGDGKTHVSHGSDGTYTGWDPMYRGKFDSAYREFVGKYNITEQGRRQYNYMSSAGGVKLSDYVDNYPDASYNNQHQTILYGNVQPTDSLTVDARYAVFWQHQERAYLADLFDDTALTPNARDEWQTRSRFMGQEIDVTLTWDYTEDVSFGLLCGWFFAGDHYYDDDESAQDYVGTMKLSF